MQCSSSTSNDPGLPQWPEDDTLLRVSSPRWQNCCRELCVWWRTIGGLRASDLDALERRQKAAEWSNVFSDGEWGSESALSGPGSQASDTLGEVELADMEHWAGEIDERLTASRWPSSGDDECAGAAAQMEQPNGGAIAPARPAMSPGMQHPPQRPPQEASLRAAEAAESCARGEDEDSIAGSERRHIRAAELV